MASQTPSSVGYSLYVGDLAPDVTEAILYDVFKQVGPIVSIRVCRDAVTRQSLHYGYVNFASPQDAERARETLNYQPVHGKPIRIMWCQKDASVRRHAKGNIIIKNLPKAIDNQTLYDTFAQFGKILSCKVEMERDRDESRGFGYVHFEAEDAAKQAIEKVDGMLLAGQQVQVQAFIPRNERIEHNKASFTNLEVKGLRPDVTEEALAAFFQPYGEVRHVKVLRDRKDSPFAYVDFAAHEAAAKAVEEWHGKVAPELSEGDAPLSIERSLTKAERKDQRLRQRAERQSQQAENSAGGLYVGNLAEEVDDAALRAAFEPFGPVTRAQVMESREPGRKSRGFGFVCFETAAAADAAKQAMNNTELMGRPIVVNRAQHRQRSPPPPTPAWTPTPTPTPSYPQQWPAAIPAGMVFPWAVPNLYAAGAFTAQAYLPRIPGFLAPQPFLGGGYPL